MSFHFTILAPIYNRLISQQYPEKIMNSLEFKPEMKLLEIGGGTGRFAAYFIDRVKEISILEPNSAMVKQIEKNYPNFHIAKAFADDIPFDDNYFDIIIVSDSFHHWKNQTTSIHETYRVLKPNGQLMIEEISPEIRKGKMIKYMEKLALMGSFFYKRDELKKLVENQGFKVNKLEWSKPPTYFLICVK